LAGGAQAASNAARPATTGMVNWKFMVPLDPRRARARSPVPDCQAASVQFNPNHCIPAVKHWVAAQALNAQLPALRHAKCHPATGVP
jgi:hypothetical protein